MPGSRMGFLLGANCCASSVLWFDPRQHLNTHTAIHSLTPLCRGTGERIRKAKVRKLMCQHKNRLKTEGKRSVCACVCVCLCVCGNVAKSDSYHIPQVGWCLEVSEQQLPWKSMYRSRTLKLLTVHWEKSEKCVRSGSLCGINWR